MCRAMNPEDAISVPIIIKRLLNLPAVPSLDSWRPVFVSGRNLGMQSQSQAARQ